MSYALTIGNKNYSSWSLRPWVLLRNAGIAFEEIRIPLYVEGSRERLLAISPSGKVPCLRHDDDTGASTVIWDSLAICEYLAERHPGLWPRDAVARAWARAAAAEMHSGFADLRNEFGMNVRLRLPRTPSSAVAADIARIVALWDEGLMRYGKEGAFLCGGFTAVDAFFCPVAFRFRTYGVSPRGAAGDYLQVLLDLPAMREWADAAAREKEVLPAFDPPEVGARP